MRMLTALSIGGLWLAVASMGVYSYYSFISIAHHKSFTIYLPLAVVFLIVSLYARKRLKTLKSNS